MNKELSKLFDPKNIENKWYEFWESKGYYAIGHDDNKVDNFSILLPPPNVTCLLYTSPSPRDMRRSRMPSSA